MPFFVRCVIKFYLSPFGHYKKRCIASHSYTFKTDFIITESIVSLSSFRSSNNMSIKIGTSDVSNILNIGPHSGNNELKLGDTAMAKPNETAVQKGIRAVGNVIESGSEVLTAPARWLKDMQNNWFGYMIVLAIILSTVAFFYCVVRFHLLRRRNSTSKSNLIELASVLKNTHPISLKQQVAQAISSIEKLPV
jgi:hypothetical protein